MVKIEIEIKEIENGFIVDDSYYGNEHHYKTFGEAKEKAIDLLDEFQKDEELK